MFGVVSVKSIADSVFVANVMCVFEPFFRHTKLELCSVSSNTFPRLSVVIEPHIGLCAFMSPSIMNE